MELVPEVLAGLKDAGLAEVPVIVGGIIPESDADALEAQGVAAVFTPKDFDMTQVMNRIVDEIRRANHLDPA
jgi:(2R)-ethylmalonyl-CoA mutase